MGGIASTVSKDFTPRSIVNYFSAGGATPYIVAVNTPAKTTLSGALTANTLKTMLTISGAGVLKFAGVQSLDTTSRTLRLTITLDGVVVFDATTAATTVTSATQVGVGGLTIHTAATPSFIPEFERVPFNVSCVVEIASSLSETDKLAALLAYETR